jgi:hypothetical protein
MRIVVGSGFGGLADRPFLRPWDMVKIIPAMHRSYDWSVCYGTAAVAA